MTRSRSNPNRELFGIVGSLPAAGAEQAWWNAQFDTCAMDAFMDYYPTKKENLPERLSEMFHFDRRGYIVAKQLQKAIIPLLDRLDASGAEEGSVDTVVNDRGVLAGYFCRSDRVARRALWGVGE